MRNKILMTLALLITAVTGAWAQTQWTSGDCTVTLSNGTLTVSGKGAMADYESSDKQPWQNNRNDITSVVVESGVTTVGNYAFYYFENLTSVTLPEGLTRIGENAFINCVQLTSVTIPSTVTTIGADAFYGCAGMTDVNLYADPANLNWNENACDDFKKVGSTKCHVLAEHLSAYQTKFYNQVHVTFVGDLQPLPGTMVLNSDKTVATMTMPASDVTVNYELVRDMQDQKYPVTFSGLPTTTTAPIIVKKGSDGKYQPAEELKIQLIDPLAAAEAQNIIAADGITVKVLVGNGGTPIEYDQENPITLEDFLADMKPGYYWIKAEATDENSPYDGTVYSSEFTVVEQYDLNVKPADEYSIGKLDKVIVGSGTEATEITPDATTGEATREGIDPETEVKLTTTTGYIITDVNATNINQVAISEAKTEATFTMPQSDVTATYTIKRDMSVNMAVTVQDAEQNSRFRVQKQGNTFVPVGMDMAQIVALFTVHDNIEDKDLTANNDFTVQFFAVDDNDQPYGTAIPFNNFDFAPGRYVAKAVAASNSNYSGETALSNVFTLFQGYEVEVPAGEYITYYKDEALYVEDTEAKLYTITAVSGTTATADELTIAPANTPILVKNNGSETKTILLIPTTTDTPDNVTPYEGFTGTLEAATIAASDATQDNYAWNGLQFVWVKTALSIAANKAWLQVPATASAPQRIQIVFSSTTGIGAIDGLQSEGEGAWYDLNGRRLPGKPTRKGIYILNGKKMVVK